MAGATSSMAVWSGFTTMNPIGTTKRKMVATGVFRN